MYLTTTSFNLYSLDMVTALQANQVYAVDFQEKYSHDFRRYRPPS